MKCSLSTALNTFVTYREAIDLTMKKFCPTINIFALRALYLQISVAVTVLHDIKCERLSQGPAHVYDGCVNIPQQRMGVLDMLLKNDTRL